MIGASPWPMLWVLAGSALGGMARYWLSGVVSRSVGETFPWGTLAVNVSGAFAIGTLAGALAPLPAADWQPGIRYLLVLGFLGSYTTVSSFSLQTLALARNGQWRAASGNVLMSGGLCLLAAGLGYALGGRGV